MANVLGELFQSIADAIRSKTGSTDTLKPNQFPAAIEGITTGGGSSADVRYVTFMNGTEVLYKKPVAVGDDCVDVLQKGLIETPTKESTVQYNYTFYGWGASDNGAADANILKNITEDKTVYAIFTATVQMYTITYLDSDGVTVLKTESLAYGSMPSYEPIKEGFIFSGWVETLVAVVGDATYTAKWDADNGIEIYNGTISAGYADGTYGNLYHSTVFSLVPGEEAFASGDTLVVTIDGVTKTLTAYATTISTPSSSRSFVCVGNIKVIKTFNGQTVTSYTVSKNKDCTFCFYSSGTDRLGYFFPNKGPYTVTIRRM